MKPLQSSNLRTAVIAGLVLLFLASLAYLDYGNYRSGMRGWNMVVSTLLLAVPLALLYFSTGVLLAAWDQRRAEGRLSAGLSRCLFWTPRIASVLITLFVALFSLDVFDGRSPIWNQILGFLIHSIPAIIMAVFVFLAWRWPRIGFYGFLVIAVFFLRFLLGGEISQLLGMVLLFSGPMAVIAALYWANWKWTASPPGEAPAA